MSTCFTGRQEGLEKDLNNLFEKVLEREGRVCNGLELRCEGKACRPVRSIGIRRRGSAVSRTTD